jgi:hypothetical protein
MRRRWSSFVSIIEQANVDIEVGSMHLSACHDTTVELACVSPADVYRVWPQVAPRFRSATRRTGISAFEDIEREILKGDALLWLALSGDGRVSHIDAAAATRLELTEAGKVCVITACAGNNMACWLPLIAGIEAYAKAEGCRNVRIFGRKGWLRVLDGYRQTHVILDKELD